MLSHKKLLITKIESIESHTLTENLQIIYIYIYIYSNYYTKFHVAIDSAFYIERWHSDFVYLFKGLIYWYRYQ